MLKLAIPQLSVLPLFTSPMLRVACPELFRKIDGFLHLAVGPVMSRTVTFAVQVDVLPPTSVALNVAVCTPICEQLNVLGVSVKVREQLSEEPLFTVIAGTVTEPFAPRLAVTFLHFATGGFTSLTVTVALQVAVLPFPSLAVRVTRLFPTLLQLKLLFTTDTRFTVPQLSEPDWYTLAGVMLTFPVASRLAMKGLQMITGGVASVTVTVKEQVLVLLFTSVARQTLVVVPTGKVPPEARPLCKVTD